jgi:DNA repair exonuclease SbcCD ATPase subunit
MFSESDKKEIILALKSGNIFSLNEELLGKLGLSFGSTKQVAELDLTEFNKEKEEASLETKDAVLSVGELTLEEKEQKLFSEEKKEKLSQVENLTPETEIKAGIKQADSIDEKLDKLKNHKIIEEYEHELKDVRKDLRELIFEYNVISAEAENVYDSKEADALLDRLNAIIKKIEELKSRLNIQDIDKYDDNYLYVLVADYIEEFKNKNFVSDIKDSALYIMISEKLDELDNKKGNLQNKIDNKKTSLELDEIRMEQIKDKYYNFEKFNNEISKFQEMQDKLLDEIKDKMSKAVSVQDRVETQVVGMHRQSRRLLTLMGASLMLPGARTARGLATMAASYLYFMRNIMRPNVRTRTLRTIKVEDYHKEIESSINELDNVENLLKKTSKQIEATIKEVETEFKDYINHIPECRELLTNLEKIKQEIEEKEYELKKIKEQQEKNLEKNDAKVKTMTNE